MSTIDQQILDDYVASFPCQRVWVLYKCGYEGDKGELEDGVATDDAVFAEGF
jgi:hypothetical protein